MLRDHQATKAFALLGVVEAIVFSISGNSYTASDLVFIGAAGIIGGLVGRAMWRLLVVSHDRWTLPIRGALAGGFTGWVSLFPATIIYITLNHYIDQYPTVASFIGSLASHNVLLELGGSFVVFGILATVGIGWITIPIGAFVGYIVGRKRNQNDSDNLDDMNEESRIEHG